MRQALRIHEMSDREYRRYQLLRRRKIELKNRLMIFAVIFCFMMFFSFLFQTMRSSANSTDEIKYKYYKLISVEADQTLWEIADRFMDCEVYRDKAAYIAEVVSINGLSDASSIRNGQKITVPYYSTENIH